MGDTLIDINQASVEDFEQLKGIGKSRAKAIIVYRKQRRAGIFHSLNELSEVPGINKNIIRQNQKLLTCSRKRKSKSGTRKLKRKMINSSDSGSGSICESPSGSRGSGSREDSGSSRQSYEDSSEEEEVSYEKVSVLDFDYLEEDSNHCAIDYKPDQYPSGSIPLDGTSSDSIRQDKSMLSSRLKMFSSGGDTPNEDGVSIDVPLSPMRLTDEELVPRRDLHIDRDDQEQMIVDEKTNLVCSKAQNKRKSELCCENRNLRPLKKSLKAIETFGDQTESKYSPTALKMSPPPSLKQWLSKFGSWSPTQKLVALDSLIKVCDLGQVRHIHQTILPKFQRDFISLLPKELALHVLGFLDPKDLLAAAQTCKYWNMLTADNLLWKKKCMEASLENLQLPVMPRRKKNANIVNHSSPYKAAFMRQHRIEMNWRINPLTPPRILRGHDDHVITCLQFSDNIIVSGSDDNTLKLWNATTGKAMRTLVGHTGGVWSSQMCNKYIVSGSTDRMVRVWNVDTGECIHTLYGHTSTVRCLHLHGQKVVSGSRDATLRVWDVVSGVCEHVLVGHVAAVRCVQYNGKLVVSGAYDFQVKIWNPITEECLHTLHGHTNRVYSLQFDGVHVASGSLDTTIRVWDVETGQCKHTLMGHQSLTSGMELKNNILISGNADSTVKVWDILTGQCLQTLSGSNKHRSAVTCLQFNNKFVVTSSDDGTVKLWDVKTGEYIRNLVTLQSGGSGGVVWRIRATETKLVCAVGSRNGTEDTKLLVLDFDHVENK